MSSAPHVHGHGTLNIAIEDKRVSMELEVPGMDIVGFEHAPSTDDQKAAVEKAKARLEKPLGDVLAAGRCRLHRRRSQGRHRSRTRRPR